MSDFSNLKTVRLDDLPEEAWVYLTGGGEAHAADLEELWQAVSWLWRCVDIRANKVAACKFKVTKGGRDLYESDSEEPPPVGWEWLTRLPVLLAKVEAAACLTGRAYLFKVGIGRVRHLAWLKPSTVTPIWDKDTGVLLGYERTLPHEVTPRELGADEVIAFWPPDWTVETGPAKKTPGVAALASANVLANMDEFLAHYFERGAVKVTLLTYEGVLKQAAAEELKTWWQKVASGVKNAFSSHVINADKVTPVVIGEGIKDLRDTTLTAEMREDICTALGVPQSKVTANAANYATKQGDDQSFVTDTIEPELRWLSITLNEGLFDPLGARITFLPDEFSEMQADESNRASAFAQYTQSGLQVLLVADMLGIHIPSKYRRQLEEMEELAMEQRRKLAQVAPTGRPEDAGLQDDDEEEPATPPGRSLALAQQLDEAARFERWLKNDPSRDPADFETDLLSPADKALIVAKQADPGEPWRPAEDEHLAPTIDPTVEELADELADEEDLRRLIRQVEAWGAREGVELARLLDAQPIEEVIEE